MLDDRIIQLFWKLIRPNFKADIKTDTAPCVKRIAAEVVSADNNIHYAYVKRPSDSTTMYLMNCSGKDLKAGDAVWVEYMYSLDNAFIAIKNDGKVWGW
jgi:hypothetical protein